MIPKLHLKEIALKKLDASKLLCESAKYDASLYLIGYSIELALKYKICKIFQFEEGFPETKNEFEMYISVSDSTLGKEIVNIKEIRNHNLQKLLFYSGQDYIVKLELLEEWTNISYWSPELRYKLNLGDKEFNETIIISVEKILNLIFK
ncbi:HEPN domain-containing protein [Arcicella sp. DC2W]|uniref:HEPN domain-containing protein n=1 Tax=Arcicella gelida TaxID=2984195 RepID=A0ABU5SAQ4_9BACT|nr:HEPN domain-containing protein [Arcicella sp. DC2W]MEA5405562.1 HEPN domain-containing protein [Arcicella sp. DC2W]